MLSERDASVCPPPSGQVTQPPEGSCSLDRNACFPKGSTARRQRSAEAHPCSRAASSCSQRGRGLSSPPRGWTRRAHAGLSPPPSGAPRGREIGIFHKIGNQQQVSVQTTLCHCEAPWRPGAAAGGAAGAMQRQRRCSRHLPPGPEPCGPVDGALPETLPEASLRWCGLHSVLPTRDHTGGPHGPSGPSDSTGWVGLHLQDLLH